MANQLKMAMVHTIEALYRQGWSRRRIAREVGIHRETVGKYIQQLTLGPPKPAKATLGKEADCGPPGAFSAEMGGPKPATEATAGTAGVPSKCETLREPILKALELGLSAQRIYQDLRAEHGFTGSYSSVKRYVRRLGETTPLPFRRMECGPAEECQVDFGKGAWVEEDGGKRRRPWLFRIVLSHSRKAYSEAVWQQTTENFIRAIENAFIAFGGVTKTIVLDFVPGNIIELMCPAVKCGRRGPEGLFLWRTARSRTHNELQRVQPGEQRFVVLPDDTRSGSLRSPRRRFACSHRHLLGAQGELGVTVRGLQTHVPQPTPNHVDFDSCLEEMNGGGVPEEVGTDAPRTGARVVEVTGVSTHDLVDAEARERKTGAGTKDRTARL
jgi:transposase